MNELHINMYSGNDKFVKTVQLLHFGLNTFVTFINHLRFTNKATLKLFAA